MLIATAAIGLFACNDAREVVAPRALSLDSAAKTQIPVRNSFGDLSALVTGPDAITAGQTANYTVDLTSSNSSTPLLDVVIVMDASGSVTSSGWTQEKNAVVGLINTALPPSAYIGIVQFSDAASIKYSFTQNQTRSAITSVVQNLAFTNGATATLSAVQSALSVITSGGHPNSTRLMILITDGNPNPSQTQNPCGSSTAAQTARHDLAENNVRTTIFGVGPDINSGTLSCLINNDPARFIPVTNFSSLDQVLGGSLASLAGLQDVTYTATLPTNFTVSGPITVDKGTTSVNGGVLTWTVGQMVGGTAHLALALQPNAGVCGTQITTLTHQRAHYFVSQDTSFAILDRKVDLPACDTSAPVIAPTVTGLAGENGWYVSDVQVHWNVTAGPAGVASKTGCDDASVTQDTDGATFTCTATTGAGVSASQSVTVKRDARIPVVSQPTVLGAPGLNGWFTGDVNVAWTTSFGVSGKGSSVGCETTSITTDTQGQTVTCEAKSAAGLSDIKSVVIRRDSKIPVITPSVSGLLGENGWYVSPSVNVAFTTAYGVSGAGESTGCAPTSVTSDTPGQTFTCTATSAAGLSASQSVTVKKDAQLPIVFDPTVIGTLSPTGWFTSDVHVSWRTGFGISGAGASTGCGQTDITSDTQGRTITCEAKSGAGLSVIRSVVVRRDATKPVITFTAGGTYTIDQNVSATCSATDATSGIASSNCASVSGPAYNFNIGVNTLTATATDNAGNVNSASGSFTVTQTTDSYTALVTRMVTGKGQKTLLNRMKNIEDKVNKQNPSLDSQIKNFLKELEKAQQDGDVSAADAAVLGRLVQLFQ